MSFHINATLPDDLHAKLVEYTKAHGLNTSAALRDLLRRALGVVASEQDAGWREGYIAAFQTVVNAAQVAMTNVSPVLPDSVNNVFKRKAKSG